MVRWQALLLLAALAFASAETGIAACGSMRWPCGDGRCIMADGRCDGRADCSDGTDEEAAMCDKAPSIRLQVGQVVTVRAEYKQEHRAVEFQLCSATSCSELWLMARSADGGLGYVAKTECNARGGGGSRHHETEPGGSQLFSAGPVVFKAERRPGELAVWLDGHEDKAATVPAKEGSDLLRVKPWLWISDLAVQFNAAPSTASPPLQPSTAPPPQQPTTAPPPQISEVTSPEGGLVTLRCNVTGHPMPTVTWRKDSVSIDGYHQRLLEDGSLQIVGLTRADSGLYQCNADNGTGPAITEEFRLNVTDPVEQEAQVVGDLNAEVVAVLGQPLTLRCYAYGYPKSYITWWRGDRMLSLSSEDYEQSFEDYTLHIFRVALRDLGPYTCQAYNGKGKAKSWIVTVRAEGRAEPNETKDSHQYLQYLIWPHDVPTDRPQTAECQCNVLGTNQTIGSCDRNTGQCPCLPNVVGLSCSVCRPNHWNITSGLGCEACDCDPTGSNETQCNLFDGQCRCKPGYGGRKCDECEPNYWGNPNIKCHPCECDPTGSKSTSCNGGKCECKPNVGGRRCDRCKGGTYGFGPEGCRACDCNSIGSLDNFCDNTGQCKCRPNIHGRDCGQCQPGFWNFPHCLPCQCNGYADTCDLVTGACIDCRNNTNGTECERARPRRWPGGATPHGHGATPVATAAPSAR